MKICLALDLPSKEENLKLAKDLKGNDLWLKVGLRSYLRDGKEFIFTLQDLGYKIFVDLKLYDIPNTMADAAEVLASLNVDMINLHASSGDEAMSTVMTRLKSFKNRPLVLAVTVLTSFNENSFFKIYNEDINQKAEKFAKNAFENGLDGVVCSVFESQNIKKATSEKFLTLTPGIRPFNEENNDQKRVANLQVAKQINPDFIVIGRAIYNSKNPKETLNKILNNLY